MGNQESAKVTEKSSNLLKVLAVLFMIIWILAHLAWGTLTLGANLLSMAAQGANAENRLIATLVVLFGQILAGSAGIPGGLTVFFRNKKGTKLFKAFIVMFGFGAFLQIVGFLFYFK